MPTAAPEVAPEETVASPLREIVTRMVAMRDQMESEEKELFAKANEVKAEREDIDRMLKVVQPKKSPAKKSEKVGEKPLRALVSPRPWPEQAAQRDLCQRIISEIETLEGADFQVSMISSRTGHNRKTVERAIGVMNGEDRIRVLGKRPQIERGDTPGGAHAVTFREIREED